MTVRQARTWSEALMGEVAPASKLRLLLRVAAVVLTLDLLSKVLAVVFLAEGVSHGLDRPIALHLMFNAGVGAHLRAIIRQDGAPRVFLSCVCAALSLFVPLKLSRATHPPRWKPQA